MWFSTRNSFLSWNIWLSWSRIHSEKDQNKGVIFSFSFITFQDKQQESGRRWVKLRGGGELRKEGVLNSLGPALWCILITHWADVHMQICCFIIISWAGVHRQICKKSINMWHSTSLPLPLLGNLHPLQGQALGRPRQANQHIRQTCLYTSAWALSS